MVKGVWQGLEFVRSFSIKHLEPTPIPDLIEAQVLEQIACDPQHWLAVVPTSHSHAQALLYRASVLELQRRTQAASDSGKTLQEYRARRLGEQSDATRRRLVGFFLCSTGCSMKPMSCCWSRGVFIVLVMLTMPSMWVL